MIFFVLLLNTLNTMGLSAFHIDVVKGVIILLAALLDVTRTRLLATGTRGVSDAILSLDQMSKAFFGVHALRDVSLELERGHVLGLVGQNGAGKSTLMNVIGGVIAADAGSMVLDGEAYRPASPSAATANGIAFIHQELNLFTNLSIAENLFIDRFPRRRLRPDRRPSTGARCARRTLGLPRAGRARACA